MDPANKTTTFGYDNNHHRTTTTYPGNTVVTNTYDNAQRITGVTAVNPSNVTLLSHSYSYTNPATTTDTMLVYKVTESDSVRNLVTFNSYDALNRLTQWCVMPGGSSACNTTPPNCTHLYQYQFDGNSNRTSIFADASTNQSTLYNNATNEWYKTTDTTHQNPNTITWDAAGNLTGNDDFGGGPHPLTVTYNAKEQTATQTDITQNTETDTFTGRGQWERVAKSDPSESHTYTYSLLGLTKVTGSSAGYVRDPSGTLISQQVSGGPYYYVLGADGSVDGLVDANGDTNGQPAASYLYCPTGNQVSTTGGSVATGNPFQDYGAFYDPETKSYWMDGQQFDVNSGNAFALNLSPDQVQAEMLATGPSGGSWPIDPTLASTDQANPDQGLVMGSMLPAADSTLTDCLGVIAAEVGGAIGFAETTVVNYVASRLAMGAGFALQPHDTGGYLLAAGGTILGLVGASALVFGSTDAAVLTAGIIGLAGVAYAGYQCGGSLAQSLTQTLAGP